MRMKAMAKRWLLRERWSGRRKARGELRSRAITVTRRRSCVRKTGKQQPGGERVQLQLDCSLPAGVCRAVTVRAHWASNDLPFCFLG